MKKLLIFITFISFAGCIAVVEETAPPPPPKGGKVAICHKGKNTLYVAEAAVQAHLNHGDYLGECR